VEYHKALDQAEEGYEGEEEEQEMEYEDEDEEEEIEYVEDLEEDEDDIEDANDYFLMGTSLDGSKADGSGVFRTISPITGGQDDEDGDDAASEAMEGPELDMPDSRKRPSASEPDGGKGKAKAKKMRSKSINASLVCVCDLKCSRQ
jgi:hypothetical protein